MIRVLLVDDHWLVRAGFRSILDDEDDIEVVGEAGDGQTAVSVCRELKPDVVLMDIRMPGTDGLDATRIITGDEQLAAVRVVILTTFDLDEYVYGALRSGATGFLVKDTEPEELLHAVRVAARGDALISPSVTRRLIADFASRVKGPQPDPGSMCSPAVSARSCDWSPRGSRTTRSPSGWCCNCRRRRRTSAAF